ncbi:Transcription repressor OFP8 [Hibiscus syriacus]|uniref:Transcription repressor n=1 Tax=Hibiscus syriacus TaxID=106335 RepID=A0A6A2XAP8_HIBSY|nr:transcription repressor OFP7-like [Hibiscus syriacus]KAE8666450.1 Transcription repressor OFP8 [Hibiscus syriacus]
MKHQLLLAKRYFKLNFSCVIPYFQLCRPKKPSKLPRTSVPVIQWCFSIVSHKASGYSDLSFPAPPPSTPDFSFVKHHLSPKIASVDCGCRARSYRTQYLSPDVSFESTRLQKTEKAHSSELQWRTCEAPASDETKGKYKVNRKEKKKVKVKAMATVSSTDSACFSSELGDEDEETETLLSNSISFSDGSSFDLDHSLADEDSPMEIKRNKKNVNGKKMKRLGSFGSKKYKGSSTENTETPWRGSILKRTVMIPPRSAEEKVAESVAVVTKSENPYEDFKRSMLEMIMEKQMFEARDLEQLLQCFLSLNSKQYHRTIVDAFTEIWEALFCDYAMNVQ